MSLGFNACSVAIVADSEMLLVAAHIKVPHSGEYFYSALGEKTQLISSAVAGMNRLALILIVFPNSLSTGVPNRASEITIRPECFLLPELPL
ncbi:hypothetical protein A6E01_20025 (plasmid) [Vibrio breoganii]|uniref:Uncharacterized protein n=1 Tax=Vibrio breoganii TaxID=553239 RepID=A0AAN0XZL7_9VIBR|nr:hypothetical protein A6E01_20025 [Vibrio breoganii]PML13819.1 hypothetical protein BCT84_12570 [Vibrio breoganii]